MPDNPTGRLASPDAVRALCAVAERNNLVIISDEIYRDLVHDPSAPFLSPAAVAPDRTVVTTALSKNLAVGGWRIGVARMPDGKAGAVLADRLLGIASEIWSAPAGPVQQAAAVALEEPAYLTERVARSRSLARGRLPGGGPRVHGRGARGRSRRRPRSTCTRTSPRGATTCAASSVSAPAPTWPRCCSTGMGPARCPAARSVRAPSSLRLRLATGLLYGDTDEQREQALTAPDPLSCRGSAPR